VSAYDFFRRQTIVGIGAFLLGSAVAAAAGMMANNTHSPVASAVVFVGFGICFVSITLLQILSRCPSCRKFTLGAGRQFFPNFCSNCGLDLHSVDRKNRPI
jgi:hypothetical protein